MSSALLSAAHVLALAIGLPAVFLRGRALRRLANSVDSFDDLYAADAWWGIAAVLWLATGLARLFGPWEKGTAYYLSVDSFLLKVGLWIVIFGLELWPMLTFLKWRRTKLRDATVVSGAAKTFHRVNQLELAIVVVLPFLAAFMARGIGASWLGSLGARLFVSQ